MNPRANSLLLHGLNHVALFLFLAVLAVFSVLSPRFFTGANLANLLVRLNQHSEGLQMYGELLQKEPTNALFHCNYGVALYFLGRDDEAITHFEQALAYHPDLKDAKDNLAAARARKAGAAASSQPPPQPAPATAAPPSTIQPLPQEPFTLSPPL